ncbi:polysaccharide deacetylase [Clostridium swellfunianum]|uniref:polysaccharide deacetylase family protein n=1 Tax=Clostridium swellfunianum TaxID=1367462 RepID=UPI0020306AEB|nr:polysaccharide deacetylase [Clostridium swellfunianum]
MTKKILLIGLAVVLGAFSVSCSSANEQYTRKNIIVGAAKSSNADLKPVKLDEDTKHEKSEKENIKVASDKDNLNNNGTGKSQAEENDKHSGNANAKEAFLTFDDGPTKEITSQILDILKEKKVKATFFVVGKMAENEKDLLIREKNEGHAIANHSYSHDYKHLYSNPKNFVDDINTADAAIKNILGEHESKLMRFPGGSFGKQRENYRQAVTEAGYHYIDWNALNGDAEGKGNWPAEKLVQNIKTTSAGKNRLVILMHDAPLKQTTVQALPEIIDYLKTQGYTFKTLE